MINYDDYFGGLTEEEYKKETDEHFEWIRNNALSGYISCNDTVKLRVPKTIARIKICGGGLTFFIDDTMQFEMPTKEQRENLKRTFGIEVELVDEV